MAELNITAEPGTQNIVSIITINAPLEKVFNAYIDQDLVRKWWAGGEEFTVEQFDATTGGKYRYLTKGEAGRAEDNFKGCFHTVKQNERLIQTFEWEGMPDHISVDDAVFEAVSESATRITITSTFASAADRDGMIANGMESGFRQSVEALGRVVNEAI